jgi:hypothetical protein
LNSQPIYKYLFILSIYPIIIYFFTYNNYFYSDDYQLIIGLHLYNLINNQIFIDFSQIFSLRTDGHFAPIMYLINNLLPPNHIIFQAIIMIIFLLGIYLTFYFLRLIEFKTKNVFYTCLFFSINMSLLIKPLVWNVFHSHITNYFTAIISYIFFYYALQKKNKLIFYFLFLFFGIITVLNTETGLIYYIILPVLLFLFYKKQIAKYDYAISFLPVLFYLIPVLFLSYKLGNDNIIEQRIINTNNNSHEIIDKKYNFKQKISYLRSRQSPRNLEGNLVIGADLILGSLNLSVYEYLERFSDKKKVKILSFLIILLFILSLIFYFFIFIKYLIFSKNIKNKEFIKILLFYIFIFCIYLFIYHRKDINTALALACGLMFSFLYLNVLRNKTRKFFIITYLLPSILYASIGFDEVYEMREREYINQMFQDFDSVNFNELRKLNDLSYKEDAIYYYYYKYYDEYSKYLNHQYKGVSWYEFESILLKDNIITN